MVFSFFQNHYILQILERLTVQLGEMKKKDFGFYT